jgi:SAM-dependent methyltransferase
MDSRPTAVHAGSTWVADAEGYDRWFESPWGSYAFGTERQANLTGKAVADIGCGTGRFTTELERHARHVVGVDRDPSMLTVAARHTDAPLIVGDGHCLPFADHRFDVAIAITVCEFTTDPAALIAELTRITRPGGRVIVSALNRHSPWGIANRHQFDQPPWDTARFLTRADLHRLGEPHGTVHLRAALYPPGVLPLIRTWGPALEHIGRLVAPGAGAFNVLTIDTHGQEHRP